MIRVNTTGCETECECPDTGMIPAMPVLRHAGPQLVASLAEKDDKGAECAGIARVLRAKSVDDLEQGVTTVHNSARNLNLLPL